MSLPVKAGIGLVTVGTVGGVRYGIVAYSQDKGTEISKLIEEEYRYILLDTSAGKDETHWATNWDNYKEANKANLKDFFELEGWTKESTPDLKDKLRKKCEELAKSKIQSKKDELYTLVATYCGRYVTVKDEAEKNNLTILKTTDSSTDERIWGKKHSKTKDLVEDFKKIGIAETNPAKEKIRQGCGKAATEKTKKDENYGAIYTSYVKVCTKQAGE